MIKIKLKLKRKRKREKKDFPPESQRLHPQASWVLHDAALIVADPTKDERLIWINAPEFPPQELGSRDSDWLILQP